MDAFASQFIEWTHFIWMILGAVASFIAWKKVGFKAPLYLHVIAFISALIGLLLAYLASASGYEHATRAMWLVVGFPVATYFIFGFFDGGHVMADRE